MMIVVSLCLLLTSLLYLITKRPRGFPPGPPNLPIAGYLPFLTREPYKKLMELGKHYGDVISINFGPFRRMVVLNSYSAIKDAFKEEAFSGRPDTYFFQVPSDGNHGILFSQGADWEELRRASLRSLREFGFGKSVLQSTIINEITGLIDLFKQEAGKPVTPHGLFNVAVLNALWTITTGERICLDDSHMNLTEVNKQRESYKEEDRTDNLIEALFQKVAQATDINSAFYREKGLNNIVFTLKDFFIAGSETVSSTLTWLIFLLAKHPHIQDLVHEEMDRVIGKDRLPSLDDELQMPYTRAVILETHRFGSLLPLGGFHSVMFDTEFRGFQFPQGTFVMANLYAVHHDPALWEKPNDFYPQHFLDDQGKLKPSNYLIPFSLGKRACVGESLAKIELFLFGTHLMHTFRFSVPEDEPPATMATTQSLFRVPLPYKVIMTTR